MARYILCNRIQLGGIDLKVGREVDEPDKDDILRAGGVLVQLPNPVIEARAEIVRAQHAAGRAYDELDLLTAAFSQVSAGGGGGGVPPTRILFAGDGLVGGGDLSADRTFDVVANADGSIISNPNDIKVGVLATDAQHGLRGGGTQHALAIPSGAAGFMSGADKAKLDGFPASSVPTTRTITAGAGLVGGGDLSADRTIDAAANADGSIVVNANDIQVGVLATDAQHGVRGGGTQHALVVPSGAAGFISGADKTKLDGIATGATNTPLTASTPADVTKAAAAVGVATDAARADHKHDISTAVPSSTGTTNTEGVATSLARSDHVHRTLLGVGEEGAVVGSRPSINFIGGAVTAVDNAGSDRVDVTITAAALTSVNPTTIQPDDAASPGVGTSAAREDHTHAIVAATPGSILIGDAAAEGVATSFARSDHTHAFAAPGAPADVTKAAASAGVSTAAARSDHKHDVSTAAAVELTDSTNAEGVATSLARSDHTHAHGSRGGGTLHAVATTSVAGFMSGADKTKLDGIATGAAALTASAPANVTKAAAAVGVATDAARADHKHDIDTAAPGTVTFGGAAEGAATSLARSDHTHALTAPGVPANVTKAAAVAGVSANVAREDHKHDVDTAAAVELTDSTNAEGTATSLARSDHTHAHGNRGGGTLHAAATISVAGFMSSADKTKLDGIATGATNTPLTATPPVDVTKAAAAVGVSTEAARSDHKHDVSTAAPTGSLSHGSTNTEGAATSLARSDHTHAFAAPAAPADVTKAAASAGAASEFARADHKHDVSTATPGTTTYGSAAEGVATSLARSDHAHAVTAPAAPVNVTKAAASAGVATAFARDDHKHDVTTAAPTTGIGGGNAEGVATSLARSDHNHALRETAGPTDLTIGSVLDGQLVIRSGTTLVGSPLIATWTGTRFFAVDYDAGSDANLGYSDVDLATAGTVAIKTLERLREILPRHGRGQKAVIAVAARAGGAVYRNVADTADDELRLMGIVGYSQLLVRGTGTVATAGATKFANDAADKIALGAQIFAGTNAAGYNPVAPLSTSVITCQLNGGGAPALAAEPSLIGKRIRFDSATTTVALRNICRMIWANTTDTITVESNLPATPATGDIFYIEEPAVSVDRIQVHAFQGSQQARLPSFAFNGLTIAGFRMPNTTAGFVPFAARSIDAGFQVSFCDAYTPGFSSCTWGHIAAPTVSATYTDETETSRAVGVGMSCNAWGGTITNTASLVMSACACRAGRWQILNVTGGLNVGAGSAFLGAGLLFQNCRGSGGTQNTIGGNTVGNAASSTIRRLRLTGGFSTACLSITNSDVFLRGIDIQNVGAISMIEQRGVNTILVINDVVGSTGNTGVGLDLSLSRDTRALMGQLNANTFTATAGQDIQLAGSVFHVHADYALTDLMDRFGNKVQGSTSTKLGDTVQATNDGAGAVGYYKIVRSTTSGGAVRTAQADSAANAGGVVGVAQSSTTGTAETMLVNAGATWVQFDSAPSAGNVAYLSTGTAGNAQVAVPAAAGSNQKLRLGRVLRVSGTLGLVSWNPEVLPVTADGLA